ncbi:MAG TPA: DNA-3-methyladenine glycosylase 2 family protein [Candidatus Binatia bacterium]|nr:DNA-3-methyladenine glycosylase 2 family protein [Candidatus Binatia bacterium]
MPSYTIEPRGPFSLAAADSFAGGFPAGIGGGSAGGLALVLAFPVEGWVDSAVVTLSQAADDEPVAALVDGTADPEAALRQALRSVSLDHDGVGWPDVGVRDPVIGRLQAAHRWLRPVCFYSAYEAVTSFVIGQRIARRQGARIKAWLGERYGDEPILEGRSYPAFPRPQRLLETTEVPGLATEKVRRLHSIAEAALDGELDTERLRAMPRTDAIERLLRLPGVGPFTAEGTLLRGCGVVDELPGDPMTGEAIAELYGLPGPPDAETFARITDAWRPYRMWATVLLRVGLERARPGRSYRRG